jgi:pimeloyl-ACP methyl ester carboxylesterase
MPVSPTQLSVLRMIPIAQRIARIGKGQLAVWRLLNSVRGWDSEHTPVADVRWALREIRTQLPASVPVGLVGHSLGGRAALLAAGDAGVASVVALAPWVYPNDGLVDATGRRVLMVHGTADRVASIERAMAAANQLGRTAEVGFIRVNGGTHSMLRHHRAFDGLAAEFTAAVLLGQPAPAGNGALADILAGATSATV